MHILTQMVDQFRATHQGQLPRQIVVTPLAALGLGLRESLSPIWCGVKVEMRPFEEAEVVRPGEGGQLAVFLREKKINEVDRQTVVELIGCELR